ncbi:hypothetical protein IAQ61_004862, partial [Plenodomus lingam]|uniref:Predicted protein n=1 Tax=Leptosphaeria maculans (strain JN3 / isolate v23.1.3 / race Av1-4-5-6-7-8) TaxID=985895 RepID=E4ZWR1_LEPMJ
MSKASLPSSKEEAGSQTECRDINKRCDILVDLGVGREHEFAPREVIPPIFTPNHSWVAEGTNIANSEAGCRAMFPLSVTPRTTGIMDQRA